MSPAMTRTGAPMLGSRVRPSPQSRWLCCPGHTPMGDKALARRLAKRRDRRAWQRALDRGEAD